MYIDDISSRPISVDIATCTYVKDILPIVIKNRLALYTTSFEFYLTPEDEYKMHLTNVSGDELISKLGINSLIIKTKNYFDVNNN